MPINKMKNHIRLKGTSRALKRNIDIIHNGLLKREGLLSCLVFVFVFYLAKYTPSFYYPALSLAIASTIGFFGIAMAKKIHNNQTEMSKMLHNESIKAKIIIQDSLIESAFIQKENYKHSTKNARLSIPFRVVRGSISHVKVRAQVDFDEDVITEMNTFYTLSEEHPRFVYSKTGRGKKLYFENRDGYSANISLADKNTTQHNLKHESIEGVKYFIYLGTDYVVLTDFYMNYVISYMMYTKTIPKVASWGYHYLNSTT